MSNEIYKRFLSNKIKGWLSRPEILVITGPRQVGKTFFSRKILNTLDSRVIEYFNFEDFELRELFKKNPKEFLKRFYGGGSIYVFDEFQKLPELTTYLKLFYDENKDKFPKIILTGSSSFEIQSKVSESLAGQSLIFNLFSLSFLEKYNLPKDDFLVDLLNEKAVDIEGIKKRVFFEQNELASRMNDYLLFGGYPELGELPNEQQKWMKIKSIVQAVLEKDLQSLVKSEHLFSSKKLLEILSSRAGCIISFENLASEMQLNIKAVRNIAAILEGLYFVEFIFPMSKFAHEYKKAPKVYFNDLGVRNELVNTHSIPADSSRVGPLVENFIFCQLKRYAVYNDDFSLSYWQDYNKNEVDFVITRGGQAITVEVKYQKNQTNRISAGVANFIKKYNPSSHITVTYDYFGSTKISDTDVYFIPAYVFGLII